MLSRHWYAKEQHNGKKKKHLGDACQYQSQKLKISGDSSMMTHHQQLDGAMITSKRKLMIPRRKNSFQGQKKTVKGHLLYLCNRKKKPPNKKSSILSSDFVSKKFWKKKSKIGSWISCQIDKIDNHIKHSLLFLQSFK